MQPRPYFGCDLPETTPIFVKTQIFSKVNSNFNKGVPPPRALLEITPAFSYEELPDITFFLILKMQI